MHELAGIIMTPKSAPIDKRMERFCDYYGVGKKYAFCDGWAPIYIDSKEILYRDPSDDEDLQVYCPTLKTYRERKMFNPHYKSFPGSEKYFPTGISILVTPSNKVYYDDEADEILEKYMEKYPDWGLFVINVHR